MNLLKNWQSIKTDPQKFFHTNIFVSLQASVGGIKTGYLKRYFYIQNFLNECQMMINCRFNWDEFCFQIAK